MNVIWGAFFLVIIALLALDLLIFHRRAHAIALREAIGWTIFWIVLGVSFSGVVYLVYEHGLGGTGLAPAGGAGGGGEAAILYLTAYVLEKSLSIDNIFVIAVVFMSFNVSPELRHRILYWGILGAIAARSVMIGGGILLIQNVTWIFYVFGGFLVLTGLRMMLPDRGGDDPEEQRDSLAVRITRRIVPVTMEEHGGRFVVRERGHIMLTRCALALIAVEAADVVFAVDSVPAVLAVSTDPFIVITSNIFAIMGLRSLYFVLEGMMDKFRYLETALALLLVLIGTKMCLHDLVHIPAPIALGLIVGVVATGILASLWADRGTAGGTPPAASQDEEPALQPGSAEGLAKARASSEP